MVCDESNAKDYLKRIVRSMTSNMSWRDDLFQEAVIHLWLMEIRRPGQTSSWYQKSCRFHLQHYLASGRSVDSARHNLGRSLPIEDLDEEHDIIDPSTSSGQMFSRVSALDII